MSDTILTTLPNGLRLALHPMPATYSATIVAFVGTGSRFESDEGAGLSHFLEHMLFKGTARRPSAELIADTVERLGGRLNASTSRELTAYYTKVPSRLLRRQRFTQITHRICPWCLVGYVVHGRVSIGVYRAKVEGSRPQYSCCTCRKLWQTD